MTGEGFLARWSRRKRGSEAGRDAPAADAAPASAGAQSNSGAVPVPAAPAEPAPAPPLPSIESLTTDSDFSPFMRADVDGGLRSQALRKLFSDPRYNVMDGLDVYIDDYSKPDPLPEGWLEKLEQVKHLGIFREPEETAGEEGANEVAPAQSALADAPPQASRLESAPEGALPAPEPEITPVNVRKSGESRG